LQYAEGLARILSFSASCRSMSQPMSVPARRKRIESEPTSDPNEVEWFRDAAIIVREPLIVDPALARTVENKTLALLAPLESARSN